MIPIITGLETMTPAHLGGKIGMVIGGFGQSRVTGE